MLTGLTEVPDDALQALLRAVHRGSLEAPLTAVALARHRLQSYSEPLLNHLRGLDARSVQAVVVAVMAERRRAARLSTR